MEYVRRPPKKLNASRPHLLCDNTNCVAAMARRAFVYTDRGPDYPTECKFCRAGNMLTRFSREPPKERWHYVNTDEICLLDFPEKMWRSGGAT